MGRQVGRKEFELCECNFVSHLHIYELTIVFLLSIRVSDEQCVMIMSVRKGKRLISRLLPLLSQAQAAAVVMAIARKLPALAKKDKQDQVNISQFRIF